MLYVFIYYILYILYIYIYISFTPVVLPNKNTTTFFILYEYVTLLSHTCFAPQQTHTNKTNPLFFRTCLSTPVLLVNKKHQPNKPSSFSLYTPVGPHCPPAAASRRKTPRGSQSKKGARPWTWTGRRTTRGEARRHNRSRLDIYTYIQAYIHTYIYTYIRTGVGKEGGVEGESRGQSGRGPGWCGLDLVWV